MKTFVSVLMLLSLSFSAYSNPVITKQDQGEADITFTLSVERQANSTSVLCRIVFNKTGELESFQRADLYLGDKPHEYMESDANQHPAMAGRDRHASLLIQLPIITLDEDTKQLAASFLLPTSLAESSVIRLHCKKELGGQAISINTHVIQLRTYVPERNVESPKKEQQDKINITIEE